MRLVNWRVVSVNEVVTFDPDVAYIVGGTVAPQGHNHIQEMRDYIEHVRTAPFEPVVWIIHPNQVDMVKGYLGLGADDALPPEFKVMEKIPPRMVEGPSPYFQPPKGAQWKRERAPFNRR